MSGPNIRTTAVDFDPFAAGPKPKASPGLRVTPAPGNPFPGAPPRPGAQNQRRPAPAPSPWDQAFKRAGDAGSAVSDFVRAFGDGAPVVGGLLNKGNAAIDATIAPAVEPLLEAIPGYDASHDITHGRVSDLVAGRNASDSWQGRYERSLAMQNGDDARIAKDRPILNTTGHIAGAVAGTLATDGLLPSSTAWNAARAAKATTNALGRASLASRVATGALDQGTLWGLDGYTRGEGGLTDPSRILGAAKGLGFGALGGGASPVVGDVVGAGWNAARDALSPKINLGSGEASDLLEGLAHSKGVKLLTRPNARANPSPVRTSSPPASPPGAPPGGAGPAPSAGPGPEAATVKPSDLNGAVARIARAARRNRTDIPTTLSHVSAMGPDAMIADAGGSMHDLARSVANRPSTGQQILEEGLNARQMGAIDPSTGLYDPSKPSASMRIWSAAAEGLGIGDKTALSEAEKIAAAQQAASAPAYAKAYAAPPVDVAELEDFYKGRPFKDAYKRAQGISQTEFVQTPQGPQLQPLPDHAEIPEQLDWRTLDLMKQGMDDMVSEGERKGIGSNEMRANRLFRDAYVKRLDELNPDYAAARQAYAGPAAVIDAINAGRGFMAENPEAGARAFSEFTTPSEQEGYRLGAYQAVRDRLGGTDVTRNAAQVAGLLKPDQLDRFQTVFPTPDDFAGFSRTLQNEGAFANTRNAVLKNSSTARQLAGEEDGGTDPLEMAGHVTGALHGNHESWLSLGKLVNGLSNIGSGKSMNEGTADALGAILGTPGAASDPTIHDMLTKAWNDQMRAQQLQQIAPQVGGSTAAGFGQPQQ